jgi:hypothetical protein
MTSTCRKRSIASSASPKQGIEGKRETTAQVTTVFAVAILWLAHRELMSFGTRVRSQSARKA